MLERFKQAMGDFLCGYAAARRDPARVEAGLRAALDVMAEAPRPSWARAGGEQ